MASAEAAMAMAATTPPPMETGDVPVQQQMPSTEVPPGLTTAALPMEQVMAFLMTQMAELAKTMALDKKGGKEHLANARLDERNFRRIKTFTNKREEWREWKMHFMSSVRECDASFADYLWGIEKRQGTEDDVEIDILSLDPTQTQLAGALSSRLIDVTTGEAFRIVEMTIGNGIEAWRLLNKRYDPQTDARLTALILAIVGYKIKGKDIQSGLVQWEQQILSLERDHKEVLSAKIRRALLMNILLNAR